MTNYNKIYQLEAMKILFMWVLWEFSASSATHQLKLVIFWDNLVLIGIFIFQYNFMTIKMNGADSIFIKIKQFKKKT